MKIKQTPGSGSHHAHRPAADVEKLAVKGRARAKRGPKPTAHGHALTSALAHADRVERGDGPIAPLSHALRRSIARGPASG